VRRTLRTRVLAHSKMDIGLQYAIARMAGYIVLVLGLAVGLDTVGINLSSLAVVAGALSVGIGFGLQNVVNNFVSGLIILAERPIQIGDRVDLGGGTIGKVSKIGARSTKVITGDNIVIIVPNSDFVSNRVINWTHSDPRVRIRLPVGVAYGTDPRLVEKLLMEIAAGQKDVLKDPAPAVHFLGFGDSALNFELLVWWGQGAQSPEVLQSQLNFAICDKFKERHIEIPFPQRDLHVQEPLQVELKQQPQPAAKLEANKS
jgi:small-conductance mechanosensitive channel